MGSRFPSSLRRIAQRLTKKYQVAASYMNNGRSDSTQERGNGGRMHLWSRGHLTREMTRELLSVFTLCMESDKSALEVNVVAAIVVSRTAMRTPRSML